MSTPILATKLYIPTPRPEAVFRSRLIERLNEGLQRHNRKLTLIAAPAGFGKTTLLSEWVAGCNRKAAWLSLDEADSDFSCFLTYLIAALQKIAPGIGEAVLNMLQSSQPPPATTILTALLNQIAAIQDSFVLVLDDYHLIDAKPVDDALAFLLEHLPPQMHLVIATREDPPLPLARLRVRNQLTELRATDLRFTPTEAAGFLKGVMGLDLSAQDVAALEERTEGWIAGLQLAALSMQGHQNVAGFILAFAGDNRYIVDYLVEEVLERQSEVVRNFLLQTAILDRLNGPLCDAVTGQPGGSARLEALERGNFFVVPLDDQRHWYRYHHLFAEVLNTHLMSEQPGQLSILHRRASEWYENNGSAFEAVRHALAAGDFERVADLIELGLPAMRRNRQASILLEWLKALPDEVLQVRPVLSLAYAWALMDSGQLEAVEARLRDAERWLDTSNGELNRHSKTPAAEDCPEQSRRMVVANQEEFLNLPAAIAGYRAARSHILGDVPGTKKYARLVLDLLPEEDNMWGGAATALLGLAYWTSGELEAAYRTYGEGRVRMQKAGFISDAISGTSMLGDIRIEQGHLHEAMSIYEQGLQLATKQHPESTDPVLQGTADLYVGMSELYRELDELTVSAQYLMKSKELGERTGFAPDRYRWCVAMAQIKQVQGDMDGALELLNEAERVYVRGFFPNVRPIAAFRVRVWIGQGRVGETLEWARVQGLSASDNLSYLQEFEHITLARVLLAQARNRSDRDGASRSILEVVGLLQRLLQAAQAGERVGSIIEIQVLQALASQVQGDLPGALGSLQQALSLAEPEGYVRLFVNEGLAMAQLLREIAARGILPAYTLKLLAAFEAEQPSSTTEPPLSITPISPASQALIEPLSQRELEVLRLFKTELSGPEIARELVIALSTLRTHTKSIYTKLDVDNRRAAIKRATELDLK